KRKVLSGAGKQGYEHGRNVGIEAVGGPAVGRGADHGGVVLHRVQEPAPSQRDRAEKPGNEAARKRRAGGLPAEAGGDRAPACRPETTTGNRTQDRPRRERSRRVYEDDERRGVEGRVELRRYTARPTSSKDFYTEL